MTVTAENLAAVGNVVHPGYEHMTKRITPQAPLALADVYLKWYALCREDQTIGTQFDGEARDLIRVETASGRLPISGSLGFVIHHLSGDHIHLLLVFTWRDNNEMWETIYFKDAREAEPFLPMPQEIHRGVMCVWEFGAVAHEHLAWTRYLRSSRDQAAKREYTQSYFTGTI